MHKHILLAGAAALALSASLGAGPARAQEAMELEPIIVTTLLRRDSDLTRSTASVSVVTSEDIKRSSATDLISLLKYQTGVTATSTGGLGSDSTITLRGTSGPQTLILVNGVRAASATVGTINLSSIPLESIERIEIVKGPHSAQYGADAIGGVINIITKQGGACADGRPVCGSITAGVSHPWGGTLSGEVSGQTAGGVNFALGGSLLGTRGYDFTTMPAELDDDGFIRGSANFALSKDFAGGKVYADGLISRSRGQYDNAYQDWFTGDWIYGPNEVDMFTFAGKAGVRLDHTETWSSTLEVNSAIDRASNFRGAVQGDDFNTARYGVLAKTQKSFEIGAAKNVFLAGLEAYRDSVDGSSVYGDPYDVSSRSLVAGFGQYSFEYDRLSVDAGLRRDEDEQFGGATTYNIGASYRIVDGLTARASYATGFRAPTFNDLYYPYSGNPDLRPEKSKSYEVGLNWRLTDRTTLDMALYRNDMDDMIAWAPVDPADPWGFWAPFNVNKARITGFEASLAHQFTPEFAGRLGIDLRRPLNQSAGLEGKYLAYGERVRATAGATWTPTEQISLSADLLYVTSRYIDEANTASLPSYVTADFSAAYALDKQSTFKFSAQNIFDKQYQTKDGYRAPGRTLGVSFTRSF